MARRILILLFAFVAMAAGIEGLARLVALWQGTPTELTAGDIVLMMALPFLLWLWWRFLSPFGKGRGQCLMNRER